MRMRFKVHGVQSCDVALPAQAGKQVVVPGANVQLVPAPLQPGETAAPWPGLPQGNISLQNLSLAASDELKAGREYFIDITPAQ